jgi:RNA polymerase sigma-70 factor, ECF subfamily
MKKITRLVTEQTHQGDSFARLFGPHIQNLYRTAYRWTQSQHSAEDLVQDLALRVMDRVEEMKSVERLLPWLITIMYRRFVDLHRRAVKSPVVYGNCMNNSDIALLKENEEAQEECNDPEWQLTLTRLRESLHEEIEKLDVGQKVAIMLYNAEGYTIKEIAEIMNTSEGTVKSRIHRARAHLKKFISMETFF